ncbi:MAG TPA: 50S ribosomal protein L17 [Candidatus Deferrimicrobiaceae bacterium]
MRHAKDHRKLGRSPAHRKALLRNLMNSLVISERIETTVPRAKELRRLADRLITLGKRETLHARRRVFSLLSSKAATDKIFASLAGRFSGRNGGYTRIVRTGFRAGDGAEMAILEYLPAEEKKAAAKGKKKAAKKAPAKAAATKKAPAKTGTKGKEATREKAREARPPRAPRKKKAETEEK